MGLLNLFKVLLLFDKTDSVKRKVCSQIGQKMYQTHMTATFDHDCEYGSFNETIVMVTEQAQSCKRNMSCTLVLNRYVRTETMQGKFLQGKDQFVNSTCERKIIRDQGPKQCILTHYSIKIFKQHIMSNNPFISNSDLYDNQY